MDEIGGHPEEEVHPELPTTSADSSIRGDDELRMFHGPVSLGGLIEALEEYDGSPVILLHSGLQRQLFIYKRPIGTCIQGNDGWILDPPFDHPLRDVQIDEAVARCEAAEANRVRPRVAAHNGRRIDFTASFASGRDLIVQWHPDLRRNQNDPPENQNGNDDI